MAMTALRDMALHAKRGQYEKSNLNLPAGNYAFLEMNCDEPGCDCRRVFFYVVSERKEDLEAVITYGWESPKFYAEWFRDDDPRAIAEMMGPALNSTSPQSSLAPALLKFVRNVLLQDRQYVDRIKRHYSMFRAKIDGGETRARPVNERKRKRKP